MTFEGELVGFTVPEWMIEKMKTYIDNAKTNPETTDEELLRMAEEYAEMDEEGRKVSSFFFVGIQTSELACIYMTWASTKRHEEISQVKVFNQNL